MKYFDHGVDRGVIRIDTDTVNSWEDTVCSIHNSASILEDVCSLVKETSGESIASTVESLGVVLWLSYYCSFGQGQTATSAQLIKKIQALQIELGKPFH